MSITNLSAADLRKAAKLLEKIEALNAKLSKIIGAAPAPANRVPTDASLMTMISESLRRRKYKNDNRFRNAGPWGC